MRVFTIILVAVGALFADVNTDYLLALARSRIRVLKLALQTEPERKHKYILSQIRVQEKIIDSLKGDR